MQWVVILHPKKLLKEQFKPNQGVNVVLCGDKNLITFIGSNEIPVFDYPEVISMDEDPMKAVRSKNSSIVGCMNLIKEKAQAVFSAGSTGATLVSVMPILGKQKGIIRPSIASVLPTKDGSVIFLIQEPVLKLSRKFYSNMDSWVQN